MGSAYVTPIGWGIKVIQHTSTGSYVRIFIDSLSCLWCQWTSVWLLVVTCGNCSSTQCHIHIAQVHSAISVNVFSTMAAERGSQMAHFQPKGEQYSFGIEVERDHGYEVISLLASTVWSSELTNTAIC